MFKNINQRFSGLKNDLGDIANGAHNKKRVEDIDSESAYKNALKITALAFAMLILNLFMGNNIFGTVVFSIFTIIGIVMTILLFRKIHYQTLPPQDIKKADEEKMTEHYAERMQRKNNRTGVENEEHYTAGSDDDWIE